MAAKETTSRWTLVSRAAGLTIVFAVLILLFWTVATSRSYDSFTVETLLLIAAWLLGGPTVLGALVAFFKRQDGHG